jgi:hypothetical protein
MTGRDILVSREAALSVKTRQPHAARCRKWHRVRDSKTSAFVILPEGELSKSTSKYVQNTPKYGYPVLNGLEMTA